MTRRPRFSTVWIAKQLGITHTDVIGALRRRIIQIFNVPLHEFRDAAVVQRYYAGSRGYLLNKDMALQVAIELGTEAALKLSRELDIESLSQSLRSDISMPEPVDNSIPPVPPVPKPFVAGPVPEVPPRPKPLKAGPVPEMPAPAHRIPTRKLFTPEKLGAVAGLLEYLENNPTTPVFRDVLGMMFAELDIPNPIPLWEQRRNR